MIDTLKISIANLHKYPHLRGVLETLRSKELGALQLKSINVPFVRFNEGETSAIYSGKIKLPSSHYSVAYRLDLVRDSVDLSFSIPKAIYGHNIRMFVKHKSDSEFDALRATNITDNLEDTFWMLHFYVRQFNIDFLNVDLIDIKLHRFDLCFNQFFETKTAKFNYLQILKKKRPRNSPGGSSIYRTGIYTVRKNTTCKIYDKGAEFAKNDFKELSKVKHMSVVKNLLHTADRILRYETEFKKSFFKAIIRTEIDSFKSKDNKNCPFLNYMFSKFSTKAVLENFIERSYTPEFNFDPTDINFFNPKLFNYATRYFRLFLQQWKVTPIDVGELDKRIENNNKVAVMTGGVVKRIQINRLKCFVNDLEKYGKDGLLEAGLYSKSSYYRFLAKLNSIGYGRPEIAAPAESFLDNWNLNEYHDLFF